MPVMIKAQDGGIWEVHGLEPSYSPVGVFIYGYIADRKLVRLGKYESREQAGRVMRKLEKWYTELVPMLSREENNDGEINLAIPRIFRMPQAEELWNGNQYSCYGA